MTTNKTHEAIEQFLTAAGVTYSVVPMGETKRGDWECDHWRVSFNTLTTDYYTGTGHRKPVANAPKPDWVNPRCMAAVAWRERYVRPVRPHPAGVLYSLIMDAEALDDSFLNWCDTFGYSSDSLSAFDTYRACCEIGVRLKQVFTPAQISELRDLLQDY